MAKGFTFQRISVLALVALLAITLITLFKSALELEDAEQAYYSQWLRWGYDDQPPLYTWLQYGLHQLLGVHKLSLSIFRGFLFAATLLLLYAFAKRRSNQDNTATLAVLVLVFVPVYIDFTFRRLSHTSLLCLAIVGTYYIIQLLLQKKSPRNYMLLGLAIGIGLLSKYNYVLFLIPFFIVSLWDRPLRAILWHRSIGITLLVVSLLVSPHLYWLLGPQEYQMFLKDSLQSKMESEAFENGFSLMPLWAYLKGLSGLFGPLFMLVLLGGLSRQIVVKCSRWSWFQKLCMVQLAFLAGFFLLFQSKQIETRWLLPLFIPFSVLFMETVQCKHPKRMVSIGFGLFYGIVFLQGMRTPIEQFLEIPSSVHFSFQPIETKLQEKYSDYQWILPNVTYAGNVRILCPDRTILSMDDYSLPMSHVMAKKGLSVVLDKALYGDGIPVDSIIGFGREKENLYFYTH